MPFTNKAAYQPAQKAPALEVKSAPYTPPSATKIVVQNAAVAINPIDWLIQSRGDIMFTHLKYPFVLGSDIAGEVVEVGKSVTRLKAGDRVLAFGMAANQTVNDPTEGGFQNYTVVNADLAVPIPSTLSYEAASVIPLGLVTAASALFEKATLGLELPTEPARRSLGKTAIVWGGSTSVGCNAIQLAVAAGYDVISTASPKNHAYLKTLGASQVFDYKSPTVVKDIVTTLKGKNIAGAVAIGRGAAELLMDILDKSKGNKFVAMCTFPVPEKEPTSLIFFRTVIYFVSWLVAYKFKGLFNGVKTNLVAASAIVTSGVGRHIFTDYLPKALEAGTFVPAPEHEVVGQGLEAIQEAFDLQRKGVSAKKLVVTI
jgi:NADPH:quinone reductase-like Zn-dependent oxidoreductase